MNMPTIVNVLMFV